MLKLAMFGPRPFYWLLQTAAAFENSIEKSGSGREASAEGLTLEHRRWRTGVGRMARRREASNERGPGMHFRRHLFSCVASR